MSDLRLDEDGLPIVDETGSDGLSVTVEPINNSAADVELDDDGLPIVPEEENLQLPSPSAPEEAPRPDLMSAVDMALQGMIDGTMKLPGQMLQVPGQLYDYAKKAGERPQNMMESMIPGGKMSAQLYDDISERFSSQSGAQTAADLGTAATSIVPPVGMAMAPILRTLADASDEKRGLVPPTTTDQKAYKFGEMTGPALAGNAVAGGLSSGLRVAKRIGAGRADDIANKEVALANKARDVNLEYANDPNAVPNALGRPSGNSTMEQVIVSQIRDAEPVMDATGIMTAPKGATFNPETMRFEGKPGAPSVTSLREVAENIDNNLPVILKKKNDVINAFEKEAQMLAREADPAFAVKPLYFKDLGIDMSDVPDGVLPGAVGDSTPAVRASRAARREIIENLQADMRGRKSAGLVNERGNPLQASDDGTGLTISQISRKIQQTQKELAELGAFDEAQGSLKLGNKEYSSLEVQEMVRTQTQIMGALKDGLRQKMAEVYQKAGASMRDTSEFMKTVGSLDSVDMLNDIVHNLIPMKREFQRFSDLQSKQTAVSAPTPRGGFREADIPTNFVQPSGTVPITVSGIRNTLAQKLIQKLVGAEPPSPVNQEVNLRNQMLTRQQRGVSDITDTFSMRSNPPPPITPMRDAKGMIEPGNYLDPLTPNKTGVAIASVLGTKLATPLPPEPKKIPRTLEGFAANKEPLMQAVASKAGPEAAKQLAQVLDANSAPAMKERAVGEFLSTFPELSDVFAPSRSGAASEFQGKIQSDKEKAEIAASIQTGDMSYTEKAMKWKSLWGNGTYEGKALQ